MSPDPGASAFKVDYWRTLARCRAYGEAVSSDSWFTAKVDGRSQLTGAIDPEELGRIAASWRIPPGASTGTRLLWDRAIGQFRSGPLAYENFTDSVRTGFEAVDAALRYHVADLLDDGKRRTFGPLIELARGHARLSPEQHEWLTKHALLFRNRLTHADGAAPVVLSPAMAAQMLAGISRFLVDLHRRPD